MATNGNGDDVPPPGGGDLPVPDLRTMDELCQPTLNCQGGPTVPIAIQATNFRLKNDIIQQVQNSCQFHGLPEIVALKAKMAKINKNLMKVLHINQQVKAFIPSCETCGGPHSYNDCPATVGQTQNVYAAGAYNQGGFNQNQNRNNQNQNYQNQNRNQGNNHGIPQWNNQKRNQYFQGASHSQNPPQAYQASAYRAPGYQALVYQALISQSQVVTTTEFINYMKENDAILKNMQTNMTSLTNYNLELNNMFGQFMKMNTASSSGLGTLPSNTITNPKEDLKGITARSGNAYKRPTIPTISSSPQVVERETEVTKDTVHPTNNESTKDVQPSSLLTNKEKLFELARTPLNEHCLTVLLKKLPEKLGDPDKFLIPGDFSGMDECLALADLGASINLMPLSVWNKLSLFELSPTFNRIDLIDVAYEEYSQEVLGFSVSGNLTPSIKPIVSNSSPALTPFGDSDFLLEETDALLAIDDEPISPEFDGSYYDSKGGILLFEEFLIDDPS
uniref:Reverse transcriptase domain-containing protein n=1 Tax=Tanacetum cinerariifolium TaxID=118510 RepID=A0A6L2KXG3_TANCI|nr:reverse transcriptase domain-containing protein [Tanacetum cinerariifolium]